MTTPTTTGKLDPAAVERFTAGMRGEVIQPGASNYDDARTLYNAMIDRRPALIARCANVADVAHAVRFGREHDLMTAIRGGGHNVAGKAMCDDGLVIDLSTMDGVRVDPAARTAHVEGGAVWGQVDHTTHEFGLATPCGIISTTGVAGLTLGGGFGFLSRQYGLSCDNLLEADIVTANGKLLKASEEENADLFWALRGGGGNFGVVTSFKFRLHPVKNIYGGVIFYPIDKSREVMRFYRDFIRDAPREIGAYFGFHIGPPVPFIPEHLQYVPMGAIFACYTGPMDKAEEALRPLREVTEPALELLQEMPYPALQTILDDLLPHGLQHYWKADFVHDLTDEAIEKHVEHGPKVPVFQSTMHLYPLNGAVQDVPSEATAFSYRDADFVHNIVAIYPDPADTPANTRWVREYWDALHPYSADGAYVNFMMADEGQDRVRATYRNNYDRLSRIKKKYDPDNFFRVNQNIEPSP